MNKDDRPDTLNKVSPFIAKLGRFIGGLFCRISLRLMALALGFGLVIWIGDSLFDFFVFSREDATFWDVLVLQPPSHDLYTRLFIMLNFVGFGLVMSFHIDKRKEVEQALRESESKYRNLVEQSRQGMVIAQDNPMRITFASKAMEAITGYSPERLTQFAPEELIALIHSDDRDTFFGNFRDRIAGKQIPSSHEYRFTHKNGQTRWVELFSTRIEYQGEPATQTLFLDITDQKEAEQQLAFQALLLDQIQDQVTATDLDGYITYVNDAECRTFGKSKDELLGQHIEQYGDDPERGATQQEIIDKTLTEGHWRGEVVNFTEEGRDIVMDTRTQLIFDQSDEPIGMVGIATDITERKRIEKELEAYRHHLEDLVEQRTKELRNAQEKILRQERLALLGELAGSVAHELRNPLGVITNAVYFLNMVEKDADPKVQEYLRLIDTEVKNAAAIITDLLDFTESKTAEPSAVEVPKLFAEIFDKNPAPDHVTVKLDIPEKLPSLFVDEEQIESALANIIVNAYQAVGDDGILTITATPSQQEIEIAVVDDGVGIPSEDIDKIFEPLFTTKVHGIGLGLAISKRMVAANGGKINVKSTPGKGSDFRVRLPAARV